MNEVLVGLLSLAAAFLGGGAVQLVKSRYDKAAKKIDESAEIRKELREEADKLRDRINFLESQIEEERLKYYALLEQYNELKRDMLFLEGELRLLRKAVNRIDDEAEIPPINDESSNS